MVQTKSYEYYTICERPLLHEKRLGEGDVRRTVLLNTDDLQSEYRGIVFNNSNSYRVGIIKIENNIIESKGSAIASIQYGILINNASQYWDRLLIGKGNQFGSNIGNTIVVEKNSYLTGMNPSRNQWITEGSPEGLVSGQQGTIAIDKTREADNKYQLNTIDGNKGWTLMSEMGRQVLVEDDFVGTTPDINTHAPLPIHVIGGSTWIKKNPPNGTIQIPNNNGAEQSGTPNGIYLLDLLPDGEIKIVLSTDGTSGASRCGIVFRYQNNSSYWNFYFLYDGSSSTPASVCLAFGGIILKSQVVSFVAPGVIVLKVLLKGNFISVFYNDLLIWTLNDNNNATLGQHGIQSNNEHYLISNFKFIK